MNVGIDFDGTMVEHLYPLVGAPVPGAIETCKALMSKGHQLILWTMRSGQELDQAVKYCTAHGVKFWGINENPHQHEWTTSPKAFCHTYIDDASVCCPFIVPEQGRPYVDWERVSRQLYLRGFLDEDQIFTKS